jgi:hypothetical protein
MSTLTTLPTISAVELADSIVSRQLLSAQGTRSLIPVGAFWHRGMGRTWRGPG